MSKEKVAIVKPEVLTPVPAFLQNHLGGPQKGMESVDQSDILMPRLGVCNSLSPQRRKSDPAYIEGLEEGMLFNSVTQEIYGEELEVVPLFFFKNRTKFFPLQEGGGIDCSSPNAINGGRISPVGCASCQFSAWGNGKIDPEHVGDTPLCTLFHNYMAFIPSEMAPIAISYKSTGLKLSKQLLAQVRISRGPMYAKKYKVNGILMKKDKNEWYEKKLTPIGWVDEKLFAAVEEAFETLQNANIIVDSTGESEDTSFDIDGTTEI